MARQAQQTPEAEREGPNARDARLFEVRTDTLGSITSYSAGDRLYAYEAGFDWDYLVANEAVRVVPAEEDDGRPSATPQDLGIPPQVLVGLPPSAPPIVDTPATPADEAQV